MSARNVTGIQSVAKVFNICIPTLAGFIISMIFIEKETELTELLS